MNRKIFTVFVLFLLASFFLLPSCSFAQAKNPVAEMVVSGRGKVLIELFKKEAPKTVAHFMELCRKGFYSGILVHRVEPNFVVQAGDPATKKLTPAELAKMTPEEMQQKQIGAGGSGKAIPFEHNKLTHEIGTIAMALSAPQSDTGDSQWFINLAPNHFLDGNYCIFGKVIKGMDVVRKIRRGDRIQSLIILKNGK
jgi:cyclophilin family peptidyl-prolyl cis-trans isomerase